MIEIRQAVQTTWYGNNENNKYVYGDVFYVNPSSVDVITPRAVDADGRKVFRVWVGEIWHDVFEDDLSLLIGEKDGN